MRCTGDASVSIAGDGCVSTGEVGSLDIVGDSLFIQDTRGACACVFL